MLAVGLAAVFVTVAFERPFVGRGGSMLIPGLLLRLQIAGAAPWFYAGKLLLPIGLSPAYPRWKVDATRFVWWLPLLATLVTSVVFVLAMRSVQNARTRCIAWLATLAAVLLAPSLGVVAFANLAVTFVSDHFLYLPSAGIFGMIGLALDAGRRRRVVDVAVVAACVACTVAAVAYEPTFRDAESMWSRVVERAPNSYAGNLGLAEAWARSGRVVEAESRFEKAIAIAPEATDGYLLWGRTKNEHGDAAGAAALFSRALELSPESVPAMVGLAAASEHLGEIPKALGLYERAARSDPHDVSARMGLGVMYLGYARPDDALREFRAVIDLVPGNPRGYLGAATCLRSLSRYAEAVAMLRSGLERSPGDVGLLNLAALTLATAPDDRVRNSVGAIAFAERASASAPGNGELHATLAAAYAEAGRFEDAARESSRAEAAASDAHDEKGAIEQRRRSALYMRGEALRLGR
jgi:tetratricopeptide (TPR) repeat protein